MKIGDRVRYIGPSLFHRPIPSGTIVRMPLDNPNPRRAEDSRVLVEGMGAGNRPRPVLLEHLEVVE